MKKNIYSRKSRCYFDVFHFKDQSLTGGGLSTEKHEIYDHIVSFTYNKSMSSPAGSFQCKILPVFDYSKIISPGDWVQIYLTTDDDKKHKRVIGNVDRVSLETVMNEDGTRESHFMISGRDFGKIFQDTNIWFNPYKIGDLEATILDKVNEIGGPSNVLIKNVIDLFLNDTTEIPNCSTSMNYWYIGNKMAQELDSFGHRQLADIMNMDDFKTAQPGNKIIPVMNTQGNFWQLLKGISNETINMLYLELYEDKNGLSLPKTFFGVRPYTFRTYKNTTLPINYFLDLPSVDVDADSIIRSSTGLNDHDRFNMFFLTLKQEPIFKSTEASIYSETASAINKASIKRNGLRLFKRMVDYGSLASNGQFDLKIYKAYLELVTEWYKGNHLLENGTFVIVGNPEVRIGKRMVVKNSKVYPNRQYFIESYTDEWSYTKMWRQTIEVTRGIVVEGNLETYAYEGKESLFNISGVSSVVNTTKDLANADALGGTFV